MSQEAAQRVGDQDLLRMVEDLARFEGTADAFVARLLACQCAIVPAQDGAVLRIDKGRDPIVIAATSPATPDGDEARWLHVAARHGGEMTSNTSVATHPLPPEGEMYDVEPDRTLVLINLGGDAESRGVAAFAVTPNNESDLQRMVGRLLLTRSMLSAFEIRSAGRASQTGAWRLQTAAHLFALTNQHLRFGEAAQALVDGAAAKFDCDRVSVGLLRDRVVEVRAMSHTERINRKMRLVQRLESVMEECLDQDIEIAWPCKDRGLTITRVMSEFSTEFGPLSSVAIPLRMVDKPIGVIVLERPAEKTFAREEVEALRMTGDLVAARLVELERRSRWFGARMTDEVGRWAGALVGPERAWLKLGAIATLAFLIFATFVKGPHRAGAPFLLDVVEKQVIPAPFDGFLATVGVDVGDSVIAGETVLATLHTSEIRIELAGAEAERARFLKEAQIARRDGDIAGMQIAEAAADEASARIDMLSRRVEHSTIRAAISGVVVQGEMRQRLGAPLTKGDPLFEVAPVDALRANLMVSENQVVDVEIGQRGSLAAAAYPDDRLPFIVESVNPIARVIDGRNVFEVRAKLEEPAPWMRPGMEGVAKIEIDRRAYGWIWTHRFTNWLRMKLWL